MKLMSEAHKFAPTVAPFIYYHYIKRNTLIKTDLTMSQKQMNFLFSGTNNLL